MDPGTLTPLMKLPANTILVAPKAVASEALKRAATVKERLVLWMRGKAQSCAPTWR
jgi:hypothetical protein